MVNEEDRVEVYFFDDNWNTVLKEQATRIIIRELDKDGNLVNETFAVGENFDEERCLSLIQ